MLKKMSQLEYCELLSDVIVHLLPNIKINKVLFNETAYVFGYSYREIFRKIVYSIVSSNYQINMTGNDFNGNILVITRVYNREDHDSYWNSIKNTIGKYCEILIRDKTKHDKLCSISIRRFIKNLWFFFKIFNDLNVIENRVHRAYFSCVLLEVYYVKKNILDGDYRPKVVIAFFDGYPIENMIMQYYNDLKIDTITNQHGFPVYNEKSDDLVNQSQIVNKTARYYLAKGPFTREQFIKAGYDSADVIEIGGFLDKKKYISKRNGLFGVFLDAPGLDFSEETNIKLIKLATEISELLDLKFIVKVHPVDNRCVLYRQFLENSNGKLWDALEKTNVFDAIDFALIHASSIYMNLILYGVKTYKMITQYYFPLVEWEDECINDANDFIYKYSTWKELDYDEQNEIFKKRQDYYCKDGIEKNIYNLLTQYR